VVSSIKKPWLRGKRIRAFFILASCYGDTLVSTFKTHSFDLRD